MKKILLSYFGPFGQNLKNSSEEVAKFIDYENVDKIRLEVKYQKDFQTLKEALFHNHYDLIIMLGQARGREAISLEARATNLNNPKAPDEDNFLPNEEIFEGSSHYLYTKIDLESLLANLKTQNVSISKNAGSFLCNFIYYSCLHEINIPSLFIHLPAFKDQTDDARIPTMKIDVMVKEIKHIIECLGEEKSA